VKLPAPEPVPLGSTSLRLTSLELVNNWYFAAAGALTFAIGFVHSLLGERLVFRRMRTAGLIPTNGGEVLLERHVRIVWASWHLVTAMGWGLAAVLFWLAQPSQGGLAHTFAAQAVIATMFVSSLLVLVGTQGKHPGWVGLLAVALLAAAGLGAA
jgi:hypothetical protein